MSVFKRVRPEHDALDAFHGWRPNSKSRVRIIAHLFLIEEALLGHLPSFDETAGVSRRQYMRALGAIIDRRRLGERVA